MKRRRHSKIALGPATLLFADVRTGRGKEVEARVAGPSAGDLVRERGGSRRTGQRSACRRFAAFARGVWPDQVDDEEAMKNALRGSGPRILSFFFGGRMKLRRMKERCAEENHSEAG